MKISYIFVCWTAFCSIWSTSAYQLTFIQDNCTPDPANWTINVNSDGYEPKGLLKLIRYGDPYWSGMHCVVTLVPPAGYGLYLVVDKTDIYEVMPNVCLLDYLEISTNHTSEKYCGTSDQNYGWSSYDPITVTFVSQSDDNEDGYKGFEIYYNIFHTNSCASHEFTCHEDNRCVTNDAKCDSKANCTDASDELCMIITMWIAFITMGLMVGAFLLLLCVCLVLWCYRVCCGHCCGHLRIEEPAQMLSYTRHESTTGNDLTGVVVVSSGQDEGELPYTVPPPSYSEVSAKSIPSSTKSAEELPPTYADVMATSTTDITKLR